jgi:hypothetical protein
MSIEYFVEGKTVTQTGGNYRAYAKEGISHSSAVSVEQKGNQTGVTYNPAQKINPHDKPVNTIDVTLNLFFDGTLNNKTNTQAGAKQNKPKGSYANDFSNVARGYDCIDPNAQNQVAYYVEGIGTVDNKSDNDTLWLFPAKGAGMGISARGVQAKATKGCVKGAEAVQKKFQGKKIDVLTVNVYGFSRGAAAARHFLHIAGTAVNSQKISDKQILVYPPEDYEKSDAEPKPNQYVIVNEPDFPLLKYGYFGACLIQQKLKVKTVRFNFVGLYDTVASFGVNHKGTSLFGFSIIDDDSKQLGLNAVRNASFVLQLASSDEYRDNFSLTNIDSAGIRGLQLTLPGVHSDIGGGYVNNDKEDVLLHEEINSSRECERFRNILIEEGWYNQQEITIESSIVPSRTASIKYKLWGRRKKVSNEYDKVSLHNMFYYSKQFEVKYNEGLVADHQIKDGFIADVSNKLTAKYIASCNNLRNQYVKEYNAGKHPSAGEYISRAGSYSYLNSGIDIKKLRNVYLHWSANKDSFGMGPRFSGPKTAAERKRYILNG